METKQAIINQINLMNQINADVISTNFEIEIDGERYDIYLSITRSEADDDI
jgi:hypothetical protein